MKRNIILFFVISTLALIILTQVKTQKNLPLIAIANYGPHSSLSDATYGLKEELHRQGYIENKTIRFEVADVGFNTTLIPQMLTGLKSKSPKVMVVMTTPVAQMAKKNVKEIPLIFNVITDPVEAGLLQQKDRPFENITGTSDQQNIKSFLIFAKKLLPTAKRVGLFYATGESNDAALLKMMTKESQEAGLELKAIAIEEARDVPMRMQEFKDQVDFIYVGVSGPIQPTLPAMAAIAFKLNIPLFNADSKAVYDGQALASYGVDYKAIGRHCATQVMAILEGKQITDIAPYYPSEKEHKAYINRKLATHYKISLPQDRQVEVVE